MEVYGDEFIAEIIDFTGGKKKKEKKKDTNLVTYELLNCNSMLERPNSLNSLTI